MPKKYAKWLGGALGWAFGGPIGGLVGFSLGYLWDNATLEVAIPDDTSGRQTHQGDFTISLLVLAAAVMKADDRILKSELFYIKRFLNQQFGEQKTLELLRVLQDLLNRDIQLGPVCNQIAAHTNQAQRLQLLHFLIGIANADNDLHTSEWHTIQQIAKWLRITDRDLASLEAMYQVDEDRWYRILEIEPGASENEIKAAYRKMAKKYHPDRLGDVGEDVKNAAIEKFRRVQEAYENLKTKA